MVHISVNFVLFNLCVWYKSGLFVGAFNLGSEGHEADDGAVVGGQWLGRYEASIGFADYS